jgi:DNA-binding transcriptional LysR family regulator
MKFSLDQLTTFCRVYEKSSFTDAAKSLNLSKAIVSQHIKCVEDHLKIQLLHRSTRKIKFTDAGVSLYSQSLPLLKKLEGIIENTRQYDDEVIGELNIILNANLARTIREKMLPDFLEKNPKVKIKLTITEDPRENIQEDFDILIFPNIQGTTLPDLPFIAKPLFHMPVGIYATPQYLEKHGVPKTPQDLQHHNCLAPFSGHGWPFKGPDGKLFYQDVTGNLSANNDELFRSMILRHQAIGYAYPRLFLEELNNNQVCPILDNYLHLNVDVYALYPHSYYTPKKITIFVDELLVFYRSEQSKIDASKSQ